MRLFYRMVNLKLSANLLLCAKRKNSLLRILTKEKARLGCNTALGFKEPTLLPNMGT
jgi:hypothetical protein